MSVDAAMDGLSLRDTVEEAQFSQRVPIQSILGRPDKGGGLAGQKVRIGGWVKTGREADKGRFAFLEVNDGSCPGNLQVIVKAELYKLSDVVSTGTCIHVEGLLKSPPEGVKQKIELEVEKVIDVGTVDAAKYPLPKTKLTLEFLRDVVHLRSRTNTISAAARIRNALAYATHTFFQKHGFLYVHTPIITTSDCEGAGEMFQVTTILNDAEKLEKDLNENPPPSESDIEVAELAIKEKGEAVAKLKSAKANKSEIVAAVGELNKAKENLNKLQERCKLAERCKLSGGIPKKDGKIDYTEDFFARQAFLTVSGQLQVETYACALSSVYTFGPTFRAENSHTSRHLAEFWMVEPELAFADLQDDMNCAEAYVRFLCQWLLDNCYEDMEFMTKFIDKGALQRLQMVAKSKFIRITYTEAIAILEEAAKVKKFENNVEWGIDLASEHERFLTEEKFKSPVIVYNYPKQIKAFYMKLNEDNKTVAAMDVLVPKVGELVGGSQREENYDILKQRISEIGLPLEPYEWYLDLRRYGTVKHSGFGLGFERMILFATGMENIRDVIPFPRYPGRADL
ncbi:asparagine--tRNA ligase, cytoplasmic 1-like [Andrographis paniculata]|uniref:asparagine--tRNA ligase, cytoplasmic 1-like n=1 Tax=Andrographis paniculata TaxID=175694 RepID=UPI0021E80393|nr:asparagine--tRNA ligase, cytoplasmic 1-like [Andrographis paniculata]